MDQVFLRGHNATAEVRGITYPTSSSYAVEFHVKATCSRGVVEGPLTRDALVLLRDVIDFALGDR